MFKRSFLIQRLLANEMYFDEKQGELEEMQNVLNDLL